MYAVRLRELITIEHDIVFRKFYHWTDSVTVLHWLHFANKKQNVFVANRTAEILERSTIDEWKFVNGILNPADIGTRGMTVQDLNDSEWITGPAWLTKQSTEWPEQPEYFNPVETTDEVINLTADSEPKDVFINWNRFSRYSSYIKIFSSLL